MYCVVQQMCSSFAFTRLLSRTSHMYPPLLGNLIMKRLFQYSTVHDRCLALCIQNTTPQAIEWFYFKRKKKAPHCVAVTRFPLVLKPCSENMQLTHIHIYKMKLIYSHILQMSPCYKPLYFFLLWAYSHELIDYINRIVDSILNSKRTYIIQSVIHMFFYSPWLHQYKSAYSANTNIPLFQPPKQ